MPDGKHFKYEGKTHLRKHHLYVCPRDSEELKRHIAFREYLRSHPEAVREYSRIKEEGAALYPFDIEKYIEHKSPFVEKNLLRNRDMTNSRLLGSRRERKIGIYRKCDKKAKTVYWEKKIKKRIKSWF